MKTLGVQHQDQITAVAYDFYGLRMATCAVDHAIKVYDRIHGEWRLNDSWRAHDAAVIQVSWAGPLHAPLLASASHDCTVKVWEEVSEEPFASGRRWRRKHTISDFKGPLYDVQFCPNSTALRMAAIAADGVLRVYEAIDPNNLGYWAAMAELPLLNRPVSRQLQSSFALSWSPTPEFPEWIGVAVLDDALLFCRDSESGKYVRVSELPGHGGLIRDVAWAPSFGRTKGMIATACKDGKVRIFSLQLRVSEKEIPETPADAGSIPVQGFEPAKDEPTPTSSSSSSVNIEVALIHESADHQGEVWRVSWNSSGTILASTGDDAKVRFWKSMGTFKCMAVLDGAAQSPV